MAGGLHRLNFSKDSLVVSFLYKPQVHNHVNFVRTVLYGVFGLKALGLGGSVAVGEADDRADGKPIPDISLSPLYIGGRDTDGGNSVLEPVIAEGFDLLPGGSLGQKRMVALG